MWLRVANCVAGSVIPPQRWQEFRLRYFKELDHPPYAWEKILDSARDGEVTLLYAARDSEYNNAVALQEYLERQVKRPALVPPSSIHVR